MKAGGKKEVLRKEPDSESLKVVRNGQGES
jgi:hypothetical protein